MPMPLPDLTPRTYGLYYVKLAQSLQDHFLFDIDPSNSIMSLLRKVSSSSYEEDTFT